MTVEILSLSARGSESVAVSFAISDGEHTQKETLLVGADTVVSLKLRVGECEAEMYDKVLDASLLYEAVRKALNILGYGACSERMLIRKLTVKGISLDIAKRAARELVRSGYIDPSADAAREAEKCVSKLWGRIRIIAELRKKGYGDGEIKSALYALEDSEVDFVGICAERIRRTVDCIPTDPADKRRLAASLSRYGFSNSEIKEAFKGAFEE